jgi:hypothetical protein
VKQRIEFLEPFAAVWKTNGNEHDNSGHCRTAMKLQGKGQLPAIYRALRPNTEHVLDS